MIFTIPLPPHGINRTYGVSKSGKWYKKTEIKVWEDEAGWEIKRQWNKKTIKNPCSVSIKIYFPLDKHPDIDAYLKLVLDIFQNVGVISNDRLVYKMEVQKILDSGNPHVEVTWF